MSRDPLNSRDEFSAKAGQRLNEATSEIKDRASDMTAKLKDKAGQMVESASERLGEQRTNAADTLGRAASALHDKAADVPGGPKVVNLTHSLANGMESTASYLRGHDFSAMGKDFMDVCRRYPTQSIVAALAIGFLVGRSRR